MLIFRKIIKIVATRCQILRLKCTKFDFGWGSAPDPARGAYSAPPDLLAAIPYFYGGGGKGGEGKGGKGRGRKGRGRGGEGRGREGKGEGRNAFPHLFNPTLTTGCTADNGSSLIVVIVHVVVTILLWSLTERTINMAEQQRRRGRNPFSTVLKS